ncbi:MAG: fluoride efflux transporter CrcB [Paludibacteraceae bacterium]|nr:fluoride efflux transporter CrcB [Paludibacteraceae bacterium]
MMKLLLIIGSGGFLGSISRFLLSRYVQHHALSSFPYGTMVVNLLGCFLIGLIFGIAERGNFMNTEVRMFLTVGFCGGFTTFSTFANENIALLKDGNILYFALYTFISVFVGILLTYFGQLIPKLF